MTFDEEKEKAVQLLKNNNRYIREQKLIEKLIETEYIQWYMHNSIVMIDSESGLFEQFSDLFKSILGIDYVTDRWALQYYAKGSDIIVSFNSKTYTYTFTRKLMDKLYENLILENDKIKFRDFPNEKELCTEEILLEELPIFVVSILESMKQDYDIT